MENLMAGECVEDAKVKLRIAASGVQGATPACGETQLPAHFGSGGSICICSLSAPEPRLTVIRPESFFRPLFLSDTLSAQ